MSEWMSGSICNELISAHVVAISSQLKFHCFDRESIAALLASSENRVHGKGDRNFRKWFQYACSQLLEQEQIVPWMKQFYNDSTGISPGRTAPQIWNY